MTGPSAAFARCNRPDCGQVVARRDDKDLDVCPRHAMPPRHGRALDKADLQRAGVAALPGLPPSTADVLRFRIPGSPMGINGAYEVRRGWRGRGGLKLSSKANAWKAIVGGYAARAVDALRAATGHQWDQAGAFALEIHTVFESASADDDGPVKLLRDAMQGRVYIKDVQVRRTTSSKDENSRVSPHCDVTVRRLPEAP